MTKRRVSMNNTQKIQAAFMLRELADENNHVDMGMGDLQDFLHKEMDLAQRPSNKIVESIFEGSGLTYKKNPAGQPISIIWDNIKAMQEEQKRLDRQIMEAARHMRDLHARISGLENNNSRLETEVSKLQLALSRK